MSPTLNAEEVMAAIGNNWVTIKTLQRVDLLVSSLLEHFNWYQ
jgi:hypothetical protein